MDAFKSRTASPLPKDDLVWENTESIPTAWDKTVASRAGRPRRTFGSRSSQSRSNSLRPARFPKPVPVEEDYAYSVESSPDLSIFSKKLLSEDSLSSVGNSSDSLGRSGHFGGVASIALPSKGLARFSRSHSVTGTTPTYPKNLNRQWEENVDPNYWEAACDAAKKFGSEQPGRKKIRARRHSTMESVLPLVNLQIGGSSFSDLARLVGPPDGSPAKKTLEFEIFQSSPTPSMSSRKRLVCGSPTTASETEDWSSNSLHSLLNSSSSNTVRRTRNRTNVVSLTDACMMPFAPSLEPSGRGAMDISTDDDESRAAESSPDVSFESSSSSGPMPEVSSTLVAHDETIDSGELMPTEDDLKFLVKSLRKESASIIGQSSFGSGNSWTVTPPIDWSSTRRSAFLQSSLQLGFTLRSIGGSLTFLQILKTKGLHVLERCESALSALKDKPREARTESTSPLPESTTKRYRSKNVARVPNPNVLDDVTSSLVADLKSLTVNDTKRKTSGSSLVRHVTLDSCPRPPRSPLDNMPDRNPMLHMQGYSPVDVEPIGKLSLGSATQMMPATIPMQNFDFVETPLMNRDTGWGSCPVQGRDWGSSNCCEKAVLVELMDRFESAVRLEGLGDPRGMQRFSSSSNLALDLEAHSDTDGITSPVSPRLLEPSSGGERELRRRRVSMAKRKRFSLWASATQTNTTRLTQQKPMFRRKSLSMVEESVRLSISNNESCLADSFRPLDTSLFLAEDQASTNVDVLADVFTFLTEGDLLQMSAVCSVWSDVATIAMANLMVASVTYCDENEDELIAAEERYASSSVARSMERSWNFLNTSFPWASFLSEGAFKRVFKVHNDITGQEEALSVMDVEAIVDKKTIAAELTVSVMLSSLARRAICPNFVLTRGVFTCPYGPAASHWGTAENKRPKGSSFEDKKGRAPREPAEAHPGRFQYIRMELCKQGDAEELLKRQVDETFEASISQSLLFQMAFALHAAAARFSMKHYDVKLLNVFVQEVEAPSDVVLRYGLGSHVFALPMSSDVAWVAKLADYGTANIAAESNGQPITIAQFTTLENTPPDFMILGDESAQGHGHDNFGLGLCMLHLFTGHAPYEEILGDVKCPPNLKKHLRSIWEDENVPGYSVIRCVILSDVYKDDAGNIVDGEPDDTLYDTFYRFLVLFGIPKHNFQQKRFPKVWKAIVDCLEGSSSSQCQCKGGKPVRKKQYSDAAKYNRDSKRYSVRFGSDNFIARARKTLQRMDGGLELLLSLCSFDPTTRATALDVLNSPFMENLREAPGGGVYAEDVKVLSYTAFATHC